MSLSGSGALARIAMNPQCEAQVAIARSPVSETDFYQQVTGKGYDREFGMRIPARRRGTKFEQNLFRNNTALLRQALATFIGIEQERIFIRNLDDEFPGTRDDARVARYRRTLHIVRDAINGEPHPEIVVHPQLMVLIRGSNKGFLWIEPDFMAWDPERRAYIPGDAKSFVVQENDVAPGDLERTRLQIAAQIHGLRHAFARFGELARTDNRGILLFSTPYGLHPHSPRIEYLDGAVYAITRAIEAYEQYNEKINCLRDQVPGSDDTQARGMALLFDDLQSHFQEKCLSTCVMALECRKSCAGLAPDLGDSAADLLGRDTSLNRVVELLQGDLPRTPDEERLAGELLRVADFLRPIIDQIPV